MIEIRSDLVAPRPNRVLVNLAAVRSNVEAVIEAIRPAAVIATVKANAYGHGALSVARAAADAGAIGAATGDFATAQGLRATGFAGVLLVFPGPCFGANELDTAADSQIILTVQDSETARSWGSMPGQPVDVFIKIALGLERLGVLSEETPRLAEQVGSARRLHLVGMLGHLHAPPNASDAYVQWQLDRFSRAMDLMQEARMLPPIRVVASSAALRRRERIRFDSRLTAFDPGAILLGLGPRTGELGRSIRRALVQISSRLLQVRPVVRGDFVDAAPFEIRPHMRIGVLPMGRADGIGAVHAGRVLIRGQSAPILNIWTEHTVVDLTDIPSARDGDEAVLYGGQGSAEITMSEVLHVHPGLQEADLAMSLSPSVIRENVELPLARVPPAERK